MPRKCEKCGHDKVMCAKAYEDRDALHVELDDVGVSLGNVRMLLSEREARIRELEDGLRAVECSCLPHAKPHDGMCQRCFALGAYGTR